MPEKFDVAIIGGGVIGLSAAAELKRSGVEDVVVLEREKAVGRGSSARANGGVRAQFTTPINIAFSIYSIGELERLQHHTGELRSFHQTGYLLCTGRKEVELRLQRVLDLQRSLGVATEWLGPEEVVALAPLIREQGLRGAAWHARDGFLDPHELVALVTRKARDAGAEIRTASEVIALGRSPHGRVAVHTASGSISADWVVNAAGAEAAGVAKMVGVRVPVEPLRRNLAFVKDLGPPHLIPMCVDVDTGVLVRRELNGGYVIAYSDPHDRPGRDASLDPVFLEAVAERIGNRFPTLESVPIDPRQCWAGLYPETPDHHAIIGEVKGTTGFLLCAGFGGHGLMHSPAAAKAVAELITQGSCTTFDLHPLRPSRFAENDLVTETAIL